MVDSDKDLIGRFLFRRHEKDYSGDKMEDTGKEEIKELFSRYGFIVKEILIIDKEVLANVYITISDIPEQYKIETIESIIKRLKEMKKELIKEGLIGDIMLGDLYKGNWRILVYFRAEELY